MNSKSSHVLSPINNKTAKLIGKIATSKIEKSYLKEFRINVKKYFSGIQYISIYECQDTGYKFYYPYSVEGLGDLYEQFQKFSWYYMPWRWEHEAALEYIKDGDNVLEIGCGSGKFLKQLSNTKRVNTVGLELNDEALTEGQQEGLNVLPTPLDIYAKENIEKFDVVCSFQVLEHISQVRPFFENQVACLKKGGYLITAVPNNDGFIKYGYSPLNVPPHHMGLWTEDSLNKAGDYFSLQSITTQFSPLEEHHRNYFFHMNFVRFLPDFIARKLPRVIRYLTLNSKVENIFFSPKSRAITVFKIWKKI